jgi:hypothetical protein
MACPEGRHSQSLGGTTNNDRERCSLIALQLSEDAVCLKRVYCANSLERRLHHHTLETLLLALDSVLKPVPIVGEEARPRLQQLSAIEDGFPRDCALPSPRGYSARALAVPHSEITDRRHQ